MRRSVQRGGGGKKEAGGADVFLRLLPTTDLICRVTEEPLNPDDISNVEEANA